MTDTTNTTVYSIQQEDSFFRKRHTATISFVVGLLLFLLPFAELKCGGMTLMSNNGVGIAMGQEWKVEMGGNKLMNKFNDKVQDESTGKALKAQPNIFLLMAIAGAVFGLFVGFSSRKWKHIAAMCAGILACVMMIAVMVQLNMLLRSTMSKADDRPELNASLGTVIRIKFTIWYYLSMIAFMAAAFFNYKHYKIEMQDELDKLVGVDFQKQQQA